MRCHKPPSESENAKSDVPGPYAMCEWSEEVPFSRDIAICIIWTSKANVYPLYFSELSVIVNRNYLVTFVRYVL